jgi:predicted O-methyltransferase YrrM
MILTLFYTIRYYFFSRHGKGHGLHSPFLFSLSKEVFNKKRDVRHDALIEMAHSAYKKDTRMIRLSDFGTKNRGSVQINQHYKTISIHRKYGRLLNRLVQFLDPSSILELGTGFGISSLYLNTGNRATLHTIDGCIESQNIAKEQFQRLQQNIITHNFNLNHSLSTFLEQNEPFELAFIDANHTKDATLDFFLLLKEHMTPTSCIIIHDIYLNREMISAWKAIKELPLVNLSIDLLGVGIIFFNKKLSKQNITIRY